MLIFMVHTNNNCSGFLSNLPQGFYGFTEVVEDVAKMLEHCLPVVNNKAYLHQI